MPTILKKSTKNLLFVVASKKLFLAAVMAVLLTATAVTVYADVYYIGTDLYGYSTWTSCGSSAGPSSWLCSPNGGPCSDITDAQTYGYCRDHP